MIGSVPARRNAPSIDGHPQLLAIALIADCYGFHIERGYIYAAMFVSSLVEALNAVARRKPSGTT
jgi:predicted tellurium resistance membrane protein TerC